MKSLGVDEYPEEVSPEEFAEEFEEVFMILMPQQSLCYLSIEVEDDEEDCDDTIRDHYLEKPTSTQLRSVIQTHRTLVFYVRESVR